MIDSQPPDSAYPPVVEYIARRISVAEDALDEVVSNPDRPNNWISCELATLQIRMVCELMLLGSVLAHMHEGEQDIDDRKWRPKDAFYEINSVNVHPLPMPVDIILNGKGPGAHHVEPVSKPISFEAISKIYGICGDMLHAPTARNVVKANLPSYDVAQLQRWLTGLKRIITGHALMLPQRKRVLICAWSGAANDTPSCFLLESLGQSTLNLSKLPDFDLFS